MNAKQTILADETLFQRACSEWVNRNIGHCVSSLMSNVGNNLSTCAEIFDFDEDDARSWFEVPDNEGAVDYFILSEADFDQLAEAAEIAGYWDDVLASAGVDTEDWDSDTDVEEAVKSQGKEKEVRHAVRNLFTEPEEFAKAVSEFNLEPEYMEVYEHWLLNERWSADDLQAQGETVFEFCNLWIWARTTTGMSVSMDSCIRNHVRNLPDDHYIWNHVL
jgi:hypothetical protein